MRLRLTCSEISDSLHSHDPVVSSLSSLSPRGRLNYHWRDLPQISLQNTSFVATKVCLPQQNFCRDKNMFGATNIFCRDKYLSHETRVYRDKSFVTTSILLSRKKTCFVATNTCFARQKFCRDKHVFRATKICLSYFCRDKRRVLSCLSRQNFCRDKNDTCGSSRQ